MIKHIFVDEFQDINHNRLNILDSIVTPMITNLTIIGDPNQSIYGFDRVSHGDPRSPVPYYKRFNELFDPVKLRLTNNYRSYPQIIAKAEEILKYQKNGFELGKLNPINVESEDKQPYVFERNIADPGVGNNAWRDELTKLFNREILFQDIAIMVRNNAEIYRLYGKVKELALNGYEIRVQGESGDFYRSREVSHFINIFRKISHKAIPVDSLTEWFSQTKKDLINNYPAWDKFHLNVLHSIILEFGKTQSKEQTYADLLTFIEDFSRKDDGQLFQIYEINKKALNLPDRKEVILTTMHRVKGLEFDAVMVLPSIATIRKPETKEEEEGFPDLIDEEIRLLYVAYSRAKKYLTIYNGQRKIDLLNRRPYQFENIHLLGHKVKSGIDKFIFFTLANERSQDILVNKTKIGDPISLSLSANGNWSIKRNGQHLGTLSSDNLAKRNELQNVNHGVTSLNGYFLTGLIQHTAEESRKYDNENGTRYTERWEPALIEKGWILIPDFSGYSK